MDGDLNIPWEHTRSPLRKPQTKGISYHGRGSVAFVEMKLIFHPTMETSTKLSAFECKFNNEHEPDSLTVIKIH